MMIPDYPCERLENSPLVQVVAQLRFAPFATFDRHRLAPFIDGVTADYPFVREEKSLNVVVDPSGSMSQQEGEPVFRFLSADYQMNVALAADSMGLEVRGSAYRGIQDFTRRFSHLAVLLAQLQPKKQLRFGLRFVNELRMPDAQGEDYGFWYNSLNREVLGYNASEQIGGTVRNTVSEVLIEREDGSLRLRRGFLAGTTVPPLQTPQGLLIPQVTGPFYLIDIDYFKEQVVDFRPDFNQQLASYNAFIFRVFHWIVGDGPLWQFLRTGERFAHV